MAEGPSDEELVSRYRSGADATGRSEAIEQLFGRYYARVAYWCLRLAGDPELAADMAQEVFIKAFRHLDTYQGSSKFGTWLYSVARNHCLGEIRARMTRPREIGEVPLLEFIDAQPTPQARLEQEESARLLRELVRTCLDETEKKVFALHYGEELPLESISRMLKLKNASGAKAYIVSARRKLERAARQIRARSQGSSR